MTKLSSRHISNAVLLAVIALSFRAASSVGTSWEEAAALADSVRTDQAVYDAALVRGNFAEIVRAAGEARALSGRAASVLPVGEDAPPPALLPALSDVAAFAARWDEGSAVLAAFEKIAPRHLPSGDPRLPLLIGRLERERGDHRAAAAYFEKASEEAGADSALRETAEYLAGAAYEAAGDDAGAPHLERLAHAPVNGVWRLRSCEALARRSLERGRAADALAWLDAAATAAFWGASDRARQSDSLFVLRLRALDRAGKKTEAAELALAALGGKSAAVNVPGQAAAMEAWEYRRAAKIPVERDEAINGGNALVRAGRAAAAAVMADSLSRRVDRSQAPAAGSAAAAPGEAAAAQASGTAAAADRAAWKRRAGEWFAKARRYDDARKRFNDVLSDPAASDDDRGAAYLGIAQAWRSERNLPKFRAAYELAAKKAPKPQTRATALAELARELEEYGRRPDALAVYRNLRDLYPEDPNGQEARFAIGMTHWRAGRTRDARLAFANTLLHAKPGAPSSRAGVWLAKSLEALGEREAALKELRDAAASTENDFYSLAARTLLREGAPPGLPVARTALASDDPATAAVREPATSADAPPRSALDRLARLLLDLGFTDEGEAATWAALEEGRSASTRDALSLEAARRDCPSFAVRASPGAEPHRLEYPLAWIPDVLSDARSEGLDPLLIYSIIRQESVYDPHATSRAGAKGLLQLMPATAAAEARDLAIVIPRADGLYEEKTNLRLGIRHFARLIRQLDGDALAAVAAYNAGPEKARQWREAAQDPDVFVEIIGYKETRDYVRLILRNLLMYRTLY